MKQLPKGVTKECLGCGYYNKESKRFYKCCTSACPARIREEKYGIAMGKMHFRRLEKQPSKEIEKNKFKVIRTWYTEGKSVQDAIGKTDHRNYDEIIVLMKKTTTGEKYAEEKYVIVHDEDMYTFDLIDCDKQGINETI